MYTGSKEVIPDEFNLGMFYNAPEVNLFDCLENEYLLINDQEGNELDVRKWDGAEYQRLKFKTVHNDYDSADLRPRNVQQRMAFDLLQDRKTKVKLLRGVYGSGKIFAAV